MNRHNRRVADIREMRERRARERQEAQDNEDMRETFDRLRRGQYMLTALVREQGRVRISRAALESIKRTDRLDVKVQENGDLVVTFLAGE